MIIQKTALMFFVLCLLVFASTAQKQALSKIDTIDLKRHLTFISSDELQGRKLGTEVDGLGITADYLAENAKRMELKPGVENYFQKVELISTKPDKNSFIEIVNTKGKLLFNTHSCINLSGAAGEKKDENSEVVLAGFGLTQLSESDIENKIVVIAQGNLEAFKKGNSFRWNNRIERAKIRAISEKKPKAILVVTNPQDKKNNTFYQIKTWFSSERIQIKSQTKNKVEIPALVVLPEFADELLGRKGKYEKYLSSVVEKESGLSLIEDVKINLEIGVLEENVEAKNVIGVVEGSDPVLKNECVVFMAHYDHLGISKEGDIYNGADDNGSGTVAILELAEAFSSLETKPKRSIVFLWVTCEEVGLLGSNYYTENPIFPIEKTVTCINLDMVGRVFEPRDTVWNRSPKKVKGKDGLFTLSNNVWPKIKEISQLKCEELGLVPDTSLPDNFLRSSDHYYFHRKGVPTLNYATGYHADYHKVSDEVSKINFAKMKRVTELCFLVGFEIANLENIEFEREPNKN